MRFLNFLFNFSKKYKRVEKEYHKESKKSGAFGHLILALFFVAFPLLVLWGAFKLPWADAYGVFKILCMLFCLSIFYVPSELMVLGIVALKHALRMKIQNKVEGTLITSTVETFSGKELTEEELQQSEEFKKNYKAKGTAYGFDMFLGIFCIIMSVLVVVAFIGMAIGFFSNLL